MSMADELARLQIIRERRLTRAQAELRQSELRVRQQTRALHDAEHAEQTYRAGLPQKLRAAFAPILRAKVRLAPVAQARQRESELRAAAETFAAARMDAAKSLQEAQAQAAEHRKAMQAAARKQEALNLLQAQAQAAARLDAERKAAEQLDEFAEQSYWREG